MQLLEWNNPPRSQPRQVIEADGVDHQRVAFPAADGPAPVRDSVEIGFRVHAAVGGNHAEIARLRRVTGVEEDDLVRQLHDSLRHAGAGDSLRLASQDRIFRIRVLIEVLDAIPELRHVCGLFPSHRPENTTLPSMTSSRMNS